MFILLYFPDISKWNKSNLINNDNLQYMNDNFISDDSIAQLSDISEWNTYKDKKSSSFSDSQSNEETKNNINYNLINIDFFNNNDELKEYYDNFYK